MGGYVGRERARSKVKIRVALRATPAMAAGISDRMWSLDELVEQTSR
jgi:hypothetical protein